MSAIRKTAICEPLVDVVDPKQVVSTHCLVKVSLANEIAIFNKTNSFSVLE